MGQGPKCISLFVELYCTKTETLVKPDVAMISEIETLNFPDFFNICFSNCFHQKSFSCVLTKLSYTFLSMAIWDCEESKGGLVLFICLFGDERMRNRLIYYFFKSDIRLLLRLAGHFTGINPFTTPTSAPTRFPDLHNKNTGSSNFRNETHSFGQMSRQMRYNRNITYKYYLAMCLQ